MAERTFPNLCEIAPRGITAAYMLERYGGMQNFGPPGQGTPKDFDEKPTGTANLTWVHGKHTFKVGAEMVLIKTIVRPTPEAVFSGGTAATSDPFTNINSYGSFTPGFGFASFLLGDYSSIRRACFDRTA